jgi:uncharacterized protein
MVPALGVGVFGGLLSGFLGVGGGLVMVPLILLWMKTDRHNAHATSLAAIFVVAASGMTGYAAGDAIDPVLGLTLGAGGLVGAAFGARLMHRMSIDGLQLAFALLLVVAGTRMLFL